MINKIEDIVCEKEAAQKDGRKQLMHICIKVPLPEAQVWHRKWGTKFCIVSICYCLIISYNGAVFVPCLTVVAAAAAVEAAVAVAITITTIITTIAMKITKMT